jgi:hypothetical protein
MTEDEWQHGADASAMLAVFRSTASDRKLRLFAVACCRLLWDHVALAATRSAIEVNELFADDQVTEKELGKARSAAHTAGWNARFELRKRPSGPGSTIEERTGVPEEYLRRLYFVAFMANTSSRLRSEGMPALLTDPILCDGVPAVLRDIVGNPFRTVAFDPSWRTSTAVALAEGMYADRAFDRLPILADALEDAGCDAAELLAHLRGDGPHVRGCWALDLVLGKA